MLNHDGVEKLGSSDGHLENGVSETRYSKPTFGSKVKRHCTKFWWLHIIIFIIIFLIIFLPITYVLVPKMEQDGVNDSKLSVNAMAFLEPTPDSFVFSQSGTVGSDSKFTPTLDPFNASLYLVTDGVTSESPMIYLPIPSIHAKDGADVNVTSQRLTINDMEQVNAYTKAFLVQEELTTKVSGSTKIHLGKLPVNTVDFDKDLTYKGLNGLQGFNITDLKVDLLAAPGTPNMKGNAVIPNPSKITVEMGNVTLNIALSSIGMVGNSSILNFTLKPGSNILPVTGTIDQTLVGSNLNSSGFAELIIWGNSSTYNGQRIPYYEHALAAHNLTLPVNIMQVIKDSTAALTSSSS